MAPAPPEGVAKADMKKYKNQFKEDKAIFKFLMGYVFVFQRGDDGKIYLVTLF